MAFNAKQLNTYNKAAATFSKVNDILIDIENVNYLMSNVSLLSELKPLLEQLRKQHKAAVVELKDRLDEFHKLL